MTSSANALITIRFTIENVCDADDLDHFSDLEELIQYLFEQDGIEAYLDTYEILDVEPVLCPMPPLHEPSPTTATLSAKAAKLPKAGLRLTN